MQESKKTRLPLPDVGISSIYFQEYFWREWFGFCLETLIGKQQTDGSAGQTDTMKNGQISHGV